MICRLWIIGEMKASQPSAVRKPAALRVPALMTASAASYSGAPSAKRALRRAHHRAGDLPRLAHDLDLFRAT